MMNACLLQAGPMVDIHCHILPGLDDGSPTLETSVEMLERAAADGITHLVATPHANAEYPFQPEINDQLLSQLCERAPKNLQLFAGCDFHMSFENLTLFRQRPQDFTINRRNYLLVEFSEFGLVPNLLAILHEVMLAHMVPVVTHPERNALLCHDASLLERMVELGTRTQVTAQSLTGHFGRQAKDYAWDWLERGFVHFVASDAHNPASRPPVLSPAYNLVAKRVSQVVADALFQDNPLAAIEGRALPYLPEPRPRRRKKFLGIF